MTTRTLPPVDRGEGQKIMIPLIQSQYSSPSPTFHHHKFKHNNDNKNANTRLQGEGDLRAYSEGYNTRAPYYKHPPSSSSITAERLNRPQDEGTHHHHERTQKHKNKKKKKDNYSGDDGLTSTTTRTTGDASESTVTSLSRVAFLDEEGRAVPQQHHLVPQKRVQLPQLKLQAAAATKHSSPNRNTSASFKNTAASMMSLQQQHVIQIPQEKVPLKVKWDDNEETDSPVPSPSKFKLPHQPSFSKIQIEELKALILPDLLSRNLQQVKDANKKEEEAKQKPSFKQAANNVMKLQDAARAIYRQHSDEEQDNTDSLHAPKHKDEGLRGLPHIFDDQEDKAFTELSEDVFSFMYMSPILSPAFIYGSFIFIFQVTILGLIMTDLVDLSSDRNPLNISPGVPMTVLTAQACALVIVVATQEDVITSLITLLDGYHPAVMKIEPSATHWKFFFSNLCHLSGGVMYLVVSFVLIMQSRDISGLFLSLAALNFVSSLDDVAFSIAKHGFVSDRLEALAIIIVDLPIPMARSLSNYVRRLFFLLLFCVFGIAWLSLVIQQRNGSFQCQSMSIEFGSGAPFILSTMSGMYLRTQSDSTFRPVYTQQSNETGSILSYCARDGGWTFGKPGSDGVYNPCLDMIATLPQDDTYDITTIAESSHFVWVIGDHEAEESLFDTDVTFYHFEVTSTIF
jgi:hypothetical protein